MIKNGPAQTKLDLISEHGVACAFSEIMEVLVEFVLSERAVVEGRVVREVR
jgi:hypothetical protein